MKLLTIDEVAKFLKMSKHTIYRYARDGTIPAIRIGGSWRIAEEMLTNYSVKTPFKKNKLKK